MIHTNEVGHVLSKAIFTESIRSRIEADILSYGCDAEVVEDVCESALSNRFIDILDILEDTDLIDMFQAAELVKVWFGEESIFTSYHIFLTDSRKKQVRHDLNELGIIDKDLEIFEYLRKAKISKLYSYIKRHVIVQDKDQVRDTIVSWTGDSAYRPRAW